MTRKPAPTIIYVDPSDLKPTIKQSFHAMSDRQQSLQSLFAAAKAQKHALELRSDTNSDSYHSDFNDEVNKFEECEQLVAQLSLFSSNESLEDVATADLQYFFIIQLWMICGAKIALQVPERRIPNRRSPSEIPKT